MLGLLVCWEGRTAIAQVTDAPMRLDALQQLDLQVEDRMSFRRLGIEDGMSQNAIYAMMQDRQGFIWMGTKDGLNRFDGYTFTVFRHNPFDQATLPGNYVTALLEDRDGALWVGTDGRGLGRLDPATGAVIRYAHSPLWRIMTLAQDARGNLWIGTLGGGVYRLAAEHVGDARARFEAFRHDPDDPNSLSHDNVRALLADGDGAMWLGTEAGLDRMGAGGHLVRYHMESGMSSAGRSVGALHEDNRGRLWVGTFAGLSRLDGIERSDGGTRARFTHFHEAGRRRGFGWGRVDHIAEGPGGALWLATIDGLLRFDPETGRHTRFVHDPIDPESLSMNGVNRLLWDRTDVLWVGTNGYGVNRYDAKAAGFERIQRPHDHGSRESGFSVRSIFQDDEGYVWIGAGTLYRLDPRTRTLLSFETVSDRPEDFGNTVTWSITQDRRGYLWFAAEEGLYRYDPASQRIRRYAHDPAQPGGLPEDMVHGVFEDRRGAIWVVTSHFLSRLVDEDVGRFDHHLHDARPVIPGGYEELLYPSLYEDGEGFFWMGSERGLVRFDPQTGAFRRFRTDPADPASLANEHVRAIHPDTADPDVLWLGTAGGGLARFDRRTETFTHITTRDGLPNDVVYGVLPDAAGRLWLSTNRGLAHFDPSTGGIQTYDVNDGLQSNEFNSGAYFKGRDGRLYFGGINGVNIFDPEALRDNQHVPPIVLTNVRRGGRTEVVGEGLLDRVPSATEALHLSYRDAAIGLEFAALDYSAPEKNRYAYRMEGFDAEWVEAGTERVATYTNLPPGRYTFRVRGTNNDGVWNEAGLALDVTVAPPPWRTWWAYLSYMLIGVGGLAAVYRNRRNRLLLQHRAQLERLEAEQLRELDRARSQFFANVSHEFRTPLTLTLGPLDDLRSGLYGDLPTPISAQLDLARRNAGRVLNLVNQILDVARLEAGQTPLRAVRLDLSVFVASIAQTFAPLADRRAVAFDVAVPEEETEVWGDPVHLEKVFANLLSNALKFTPEGGAVRVAVEADAEGETVRMVVRDSGQGIPAEHLPHLFERFYRVDESAARMQAGTGIGLALVKELVHLHGGTIAVESEEGFGSTFTVTLRRGDEHLAPEQRLEDADSWTPAQVTASLALAEPGGDGMGGSDIGGDGTGDGGTDSDGEQAADLDRTTVLVVEDHPDVRAYVRRHLEPDYRVVEAGDGEEGLARARASQPDLIVSDVMMPKLDGLELCRALKTHPETDFIPVILLTAKAEKADRLAGLREHAEAYLTKPFDPAELRARIEGLIAQRKRLRERFRREGLFDEAGPGPVAPPSVPPAAAPAAAPSPEAPPADCLTIEEEVFLATVQQAVDAHLDDDAFNVERLAATVGVSRGHLHRRLKALSGHTPSDLLRERRLDRAARLLAAEAGTISETAYAVGFKSVAHFSNVFEERFGCRPSAYPAEGA